MSPLLLHSNTNQYNINGLLCTYTEMFCIQTCCNHILSAAEGFRGGGGGGGGCRRQHARIQDFLSVLFSPQLILKFKERFQWFYCSENYTYTLQRIQRPSIIFWGGGGASNFFSRGGGPNANFYRNTYMYLLFSRGSVRTPYPPLDPHVGNVIITGQYLSQSGL